MKKKPNKPASVVLIIATLAVLLGRAYQHFFFEAPYRAFFLHEESFGWAIKAFSDLKWIDYSTSLYTDLAISRYGRTVGWILLLAAVSILFIKSRLKWLPTFLLLLSSLFLLFMAYNYHLDKGYQFAQILEYSAQVFTPALLVLYLVAEKRGAADFFIRILISLTFLGHGLYALGLYPVPGHFVHMVITNLGVSNSQAVTLLHIAGWLDVGVAIGVFIPSLKKYWLVYALIWGFLTALARLTTYVPFNHMFGIAIHQMGYEFLIRWPHFLLPLAGLLLHKRQQTSEVKNQYIEE
jgi:hypothetical protein